MTDPDMSVWRYRYDANDNRVRGGRTYSWQTHNLPVSITSGGTTDTQRQRRDEGVRDGVVRGRPPHRRQTHALSIHGADHRPVQP